MRLLLRLLLAAVLVLGAHGEALFLGHQEHSTPFRKDLLPLETDTMRDLAHDLAILARLPLSAEDPAHNRALAQLLALSITLNPVNPSARQLLKRFTQKDSPLGASPSALQQSQEDVERVARWLLSPGAGAAGRELGQLVVDPLRVLYPDLAICKSTGPDGEAARWQGVVPPLTAYMVSPPAATQRGSAPPPPLFQAPPSPELLSFPRQTLKTVLSTQTRGGRVTPRTVSLTLTIEPPGKTPDRQDAHAMSLPLNLLPPCPDDLEKVLLPKISQALLTEWHELPKSYSATLRTGSPYLAVNGAALTGPASLLLRAALSQQSLRQDLTFIGEVRDDGMFILPSMGWDYLRIHLSNTSSRGGRLLVPVNARKQLQALLAIKGPEFFVNWEIFEVDNLTQALLVGCDQRASEQFTKAHGSFQEFRKVAGKNDLNALLKNKHARERLEAIVELAPNHLSAKTLLLYGSGKYPRALDAKTLSMELFAIQTLLSSTATADDAMTLVPSTLFDLEKQGWSRLNPLQPFVSVPHRELFRQSVANLRRLGTMAQAALRAKASAEQKQILESEFRRFRKEYRALNRQIEELAQE